MRPSKARILIACEFSGVVRDAFRKRGYRAWSCDLLSSETPSPYHICEDVSPVLYRQSWDLIIAHPPCTHLAVSGARWFKDRLEDQKTAIDFFMIFAQLHETTTCTRWCIENPIGIMSTRYRKPDQIIQPWMFGHGETKATCLWLNELPLLQPTDIVSGREARIHKMPPSADRGKLRSITYTGIAEAMAEQWGPLL
jgi:site-specific DNA-cytosine methylase